jgi:plasmid stabilization system protein ParE
MMARRFRIDRRATEEFDAATDWYEARRAGLGLEFIDSIETAVQQILEKPGVGGPVPGVDSKLSVRRLLLRKFPYAVVYVESDDEILIVAFSHGHRKPGYWRDRLPHGRGARSRA